VDPTAASKCPSNCQGKRAVALEHATQERAPGQGDAHLVGVSAQQFQRVGGVPHQEHCIADTAFTCRSRRTPGNLKKTGSLGVYPNGQHRRVGACQPKDGLAVAGAKVYDRTLPAGDRLCELADVHLG
jgi:hypothetical protein